MSDVIRVGSLVLYKKRPARVVKTGERLEIEIEGGNIAKVRYKDVTLLHAGPLNSLKDLRPVAGDQTLAWELLREDGQPHTLAELAELGFDAFTPLTAWAAWQWVDDGLYFHGEPEAIYAAPPEAVSREQAARQARQAEAAAWADFLSRAGAGQVNPQADARFVRELEDLALGRRADSRLLRELGRHERPETAHALLLAWGVWDETVNPHPARLGVSLHISQSDLPPLADEPRLDLTGLPAYAIDDRHNQDPDDAVSLVDCQTDAQGRLTSARLWVHIADAAALVLPDSPADREARSRGATLYLPEGPIPMLPPHTIQVLGLGLQEISPALSFEIAIDAQAEITSIQIQPSWVRVQRLTYDQAEDRIGEAPLSGLHQIALAYHERRRRNGAFLLDLPEAMVRLVDGQVEIEPVRRLRSRDLVREAMLLAGEAAARFALENRLPFPFASQEALQPPSGPEANLQLIQWMSRPPETLSLAQRFALRRLLRRSQVLSQPAPHAGVGLPAYSRATSPLRRYLDLAAHQQLRAFVRGQPVLSEAAMIERIGFSEAITGTIAQAEQLSRKHWTLVWMLRQPGWQGRAVLVEKNGKRGYVIFPELAFETPVSLRRPDLPLDSEATVAVREINLPELEAGFVIDDC